MDIMGLSTSSKIKLALSAATLVCFFLAFSLTPVWSSVGKWYSLAITLGLWLCHLLYEGYRTDARLPDAENSQGQNFLDTLSDVSQVTYIAVDALGVVTELGGNGIHTNFSTDEIVGKSWLTIARGNSALLEDHGRAMAGEDFTSERLVGERFYRHYYFPSVSGEGLFQGYKCISIDLTHERKLRADLLLTRQVLENTTDAIAVCDANRRVMSVNHAFETITGFGVQDVIGHKLGLPNLAATSFAFYRDVVASLREQGSWQGEAWARKKSGELYSAQISINAIVDQDVVTNYLIFCTDITEIKRTHEELRYLANHDFLTGLPNRRLFLDRLDQGIRRAKRLQGRLAIYFIDLDNFKTINDTHGHQLGDELLKMVSRRLQESLREVDTVARLAGDEFTVIAENVVDNAEVIAVAQKILSCFEEPFNLQMHRLNASASVGISIYPDNGGEAEMLMEEADSAMYKAKSQGRNGYFYLNDSATGRFAGKVIYSTELKMAIQRNQLELVYQPQVDLKSGEVVGCEALLRWNHQIRGQLLPHEFLPLAEETGLISQIGNWVAQQACAQYNHWRAIGMDFDFLAINIGAAQLHDAHFFDNLRLALNANGISPSSLNLEIPEQVAIGDIPASRVFIRRAADMGLSCAIDDFGATGESFHYMRELPVRMVKLDQKLLLAIKTGRESQVLLKAVVALADVLGLKIVGVGVERSAQDETLEELGCHYGQGYFYAKPTSAEAFQAFFAKHPRFSDGAWKVG